jgi:DNA-binding transcriptional MerR regulator
MNAFTIKDLENLSGIKAHTIRIWEQRYAFLKPQRTTTNIRYYTNSDLKTLLNVSLLNKNGFKISHINRMNGDEIRGKILSLTHEDAKNERIINDVIQAMIDLDIYAFEDVLDTVIRVEGYDKTITSIIFPFLQRIGILWLTNHMNPAQEHLVSNIVRQKIIVGINALSRNLNAEKTVVVYLPENEYHELGILYAHYLFKADNAKVLYLGASVPLEDLEYIVAKKNPNFLYTHITSHSYNAKFEKYLNSLHARIPNTPIIMTGQIIQNYKKSVPSNVSFKQSLAELKTLIESL